MENKLYLHVPEIKELWYRKKILRDPNTMSYNKGYNLDYNEYDNNTGCIDFDESKWNDWYHWFVHGTPNRFYAYIVLKKNNEFIGDVCLHKSNGGNWYEMGIVLESKYRGKGYSVEALKLLLKQAFEVFGANAVHNSFETGREAAIKVHVSAGFVKHRENNQVVELEITKEQYNCTK